LTTRSLYHAPQARADLLNLWLYVGSENPGAADALINGIHRRLDQLTRHPYSGMLREDIGPGIRHLLAGRYLVFYRVTPKQVEILRVLHGRRGIAQPFV
jgi:toxin ParE1/3/4